MTAELRGQREKLEAAEAAAREEAERVRLSICTVPHQTGFCIVAAAPCLLYHFGVQYFQACSHSISRALSSSGVGAQASGGGQARQLGAAGGGGRRGGCGRRPRAKGPL